MGCGETCAKIGLVVFNIVFLLSGIVVLGVGIWVKVDKNVVNMQSLIEFDSNDNTLSTASSILIGFGAFVLVVSLLGFCSAFCTDNTKFFVGGYIFFIVVIFIGEMAVGVLVAMNKSKIDDKLNSALKSSLKKYEPGHSLNAKAWDYIQVWLKCCGANSPDDYRNITFPDKSMHVPISCCVLTNSDPEKPAPKNKSMCETNAKNYIDGSTGPFHFLHTKGCHEGIANSVRSNLNLLIGIGIGIGILQLLGIVFACIVCQRADSYYRI